MRHTVDYKDVNDEDFVYEIMWRYINPEVTGYPEPERTQARHVPEGTRIWKFESNCRKECNKLIKAKK